MNVPEEFEDRYRAAVTDLGERACGLTDRGKVRGDNQDAYWIDPQMRFLVVAGGLGGLPGGGTASLVAVAEVAALIVESSQNRDSFSSEAAEQQLAKVFHSAHACVVHQGQKGFGTPGMATTLASAWITPTRLYSMHCGDSRTYVMRNGAVASVTSDHSVVGELLRTGRLDPAGAATHPERNILTQVIGGDLTPEPEFTVMPLEPGDVVVLCSDGLWDMVSVQEMSEVSSQRTSAPQRAAELQRRALDAGGRDNVTLVLYQHL
ncbi:MAG: serine/threonine protein phosphatase PrpC [Hyphomicrobiaceae bacterium]|jgi:serine/threonine protein phosphatase PrpC